MYFEFFFKLFLFIFLVYYCEYCKWIMLINFNVCSGEDLFVLELDFVFFNVNFFYMIRFFLIGYGV